jgi:uncharacterized protein YndB with AHSA1/START domain
MCNLHQGESIMSANFNPELDLMLERIVDVPCELIWQAWTTPEKLMPWFCPLPWKTIACEIDLRVGGKFYTVMQSPEGQSFPNVGCYLEVIENERLTWTNALDQGFRPAKQLEASPGHECAEFLMTATIMLEPQPNGIKYTALVQHSNVASRIAHENMGFKEGWGTCLDQLLAFIKNQSI